MAGGANLINNNFANARPVSISGTVFNDANADGFHDPGEAGLSAWTVYIDSNNNGKLDPGETSVVTSANGAYSFIGLLPGTYTIRVVPKTGFVQTSPPGGAARLSLASGISATGVDFGE